jgi:anti-anti-sigma regulatory factor
VQVSAQKSGRTLGFVGMNSQVITLMEMTKIRTLFQIYSTLQEAEAAAA